MVNSHLYMPFLDSIKKIFRKNTDIEIDAKGSFYTENEDIKSLGIASIINFFGKMEGRFLIDMEKGLALAVAKKMLGTDLTCQNEYMVLESVQKLNSIIVDDAIGELSNLYSVEIKAAVPIVLEGKDALITVPKVEPVSMDCITPFGRLKINIAIEEV